MTSQSENATPAVRIEGLEYAWGAHPPILTIAHFQLAQGERVFLQGPSGSGKTTFLGLIGGVLQAQKGTVSVHGQELGALSSSQRDHFRGEHIGFIFQMFNLLPYLSVLDNVTLPCRFSKRRRERALANGSLESEAARLLAELGLGEKTLLDRKASELSVGQQQRVAAARALMGRPELIIADEPTSALDADARESFLKLLFEECRQVNASLLFVSHDSALGTLFENRFSLAELNGKAAR